MVEIAVPGAHREVEFDRDRGVEVEVFKSDGHIGGPEVIERLFAEVSDAT